MTFEQFQEMIVSFIMRHDPTVSSFVDFDEEDGKYIARAGNYDFNMPANGLMVTINLNRRNHTFQTPVRALLEAG